MSDAALPEPVRTLSLQWRLGREPIEARLTPELLQLPEHSGQHNWLVRLLLAPSVTSAATPMSRPLQHCPA
jgi:hypothetical protein